MDFVPYPKLPNSPHVVPSTAHEAELVAALQEAYNAIHVLHSMLKDIADQGSFTFPQDYLG